MSAKYFRKHKEVILTFSEGLNIIKDQNEAGKTTICEAIAYTCFGTGALRDSLKEVVSDPKWCDWLDEKIPVTKLYAETNWDINGNLYKVTRSSKGAEVYLNDSEEPKVTGQKEVTAYMENLFGIPAGKASALIIAEQGDIRGVLSKGAADTSKFIEDLANFSEIDELVNKVQVNVSTGSNQSEKDRLELAEKNLKELELVKEPDGASLTEGQDQLNEEKLGYQSELKTVNKKIADAQAIIDANDVNKTLRQGFEMQIDSANISLTELGEEPGQLTVVIDTPAYDRCVKLADEISLTVTKAQNDLIVHELFKKIPACEDEWDEPLASLKKEISTIELEQSEISDKKAKLKTDQAVQKASIMNAGKCKTCGNVPTHKEVETHNSRVADELKRLDKELVFLEIDESDAINYIAVLKGVLATQDSIKLFAENNPDHCTLGEDVKVPVDIKFNGWTSQPVELIDELESLNTDITKYNNLKSQVDAQDKLISDYALKSAGFKASKETAEEALKKVPEDKKLIDVVVEETKVAALDKKIKEVDEALTKLDEDFFAEQAKFDVYCTTSINMVAEVATAKKELESKDLANLLIKDIRTARNKVTNKIWGTMLKVVSNYFTKMRGETSQVTRGEKNFLVNGKSTKGLSGSTLDILGLAFRLAQSELFLAGAPVLFLDEPSSACDLARSSSMIGLLGAAIDKQCILITHSDVGPDVCENLITLEGV